MDELERGGASLAAQQRTPIKRRRNESKQWKWKQQQPPFAPPGRYRVLSWEKQDELIILEIQLNYHNPILQTRFRFAFVPLLP